MSKISVIGAGNVGATVANDLMVEGVASEIVLVDINKKKAFGEALDIYQGAPFHSPAIVRAGEYEDTTTSLLQSVLGGVDDAPFHIVSVIRETSEDDAEITSPLFDG